jgi:SAM-dependent methyltransferase
VPAEISERRVRYYLDGLELSTWYKIRIKSVNLFGASKFSNPTGFYKTLDEKVVTFYQDDTAGINGIEQTKYFANVLLCNLPVKLYGDVLDYGCAFGQMTKELSRYANATGYDYSRTAVEQAQKMHPDLIFTSDIPQRQFDFVVSSNVLEHYEDPVGEMRNQLKLAKDYFIAMTPYQDGPNETHPSRIDENSLPYKGAASTLRRLSGLF